MNATEQALDRIDRAVVVLPRLNREEITPGFYWADGKDIYDSKKFVRTIVEVTGEAPWLKARAYHIAVLSDVDSLQFIARIEEPF